ncbi:AraC family transcriptional regulator N-terminal domain-containing protein [Rhizobacter sp. LjRoot28]|uniref:AraC family transcriptional regulator n=1 Tax=Rhizobacter sp. LjRoot28 TaxID=3342309 RepID=UPI003ECC5DCE
MQALVDAVIAFAAAHADADGLVRTPVPGLRMMRAWRPSGAMHSVYQPLVCLVLQGEKHMTVGHQARTVQAGDSVLVTADIAVTGRIARASPAEPYVAVAIELDAGLLREVVTGLHPQTPASSVDGRLFVEDAQAAVLDCVARLVRLLDRPEAIPLLHAGISRELHYWLMVGPHGPALRGLAAPDACAARVGAAIRLLRERYREPLPVQALAEAAHMSLTAFHRHFKAMTSLTPGQFQKQLRLVEARRLMRQEGRPARHAAFDVGYASVPHFTRDYHRMFGASPGRDAVAGGRKAAMGAARSENRTRATGVAPALDHIARRPA